MPVPVLIVAKTRFRGGACAGGLALDRCRNVRLLAADGGERLPTAAYAIGEIWELEYGVPGDLLPPHVEDVVVYSGRRVERVAPGALREFLLERVRPWQGPPERLFDGLLQPTDTGSGYISRAAGIPSGSVGFWLPDQPLRRAREEGALRYRYPGVHGVRSLTYVGFAPGPERLAAGTLLRVSLARWWRNPAAPGQEARCYLQLSGWYSPDGEPGEEAGP